MELCDQSLAFLLAHRQEISSTELCSSCWKRIKKYNPALNAFLTTVEPSKQQTLIPLAHKDVFVTKGLRTTAGSLLLKDWKPPYDATVVRRFQEAGYVCLGKTNCDEFAQGSTGHLSAYGLCTNPWHTDYLSGGSSSGSAVAVSARMVPLATGSDTGGSIRVPASLCNVVGIKPTYGRVSRYGVIAMASSLDCPGVFARSVKDCSIALEVIAGNDPQDATSSTQPVPNYTIDLNVDLHTKTIGFPQEYFTSETDTQVKSLVLQALSWYEKQGVSIVEISLPHSSYAVAAYYVLVPAEVSSNMSRFDGIQYGGLAHDASQDLNAYYSMVRSQLLGEEVKRRILTGTFCLSEGYQDQYYKQAQKVRGLIAQEFQEAFTQVDAILAPVLPMVGLSKKSLAADPLTFYLADTLTIPSSLAGLPALALPCGFSNDNLPIGMQLIGAPFSEQLLFQMGYAYQEDTDWHQRKPPLIDHDGNN